jgi:hypothetical protein
MSVVWLSLFFKPASRFMLGAPPGSGNKPTHQRCCVGSWLTANANQAPAPQRQQLPAERLHRRMKAGHVGLALVVSATWRLLSTSSFQARLAGLVTHIIADYRC